MYSRRSILTCCLLLGPTGGLWLGAAQTPAGPEVALRALGPQIVLYTIARGPYDKLGGAFGSLYALAAGKGIRPTGPASSVSLNDPETVSSEHWLTEIRIPVDEAAKKLAGTLGPMTDVKTVPATTVVVSVKPKGTADPAPLLRRMYAWLAQKGYLPTGGPIQKVVSDSQSHDYKEMVVEIMVPVTKVPSTAN